MTPIDALFRAMCDAGASDLHLTCGMPPLIRKDGGTIQVCLSVELLASWRLRYNARSVGSPTADAGQS